MYRRGQKMKIHCIICLKKNKTKHLMPQSLLKAIAINFKGYKIDIFSREIAVWLVIGNTEGFAHLFSINYQFKHNLKRRKKENKRTKPQKGYADSYVLQCVDNLEVFFSSHQLFSVVFLFPLRAGLDWQISACVAVFELMLFGSKATACTSFLWLGMGREVEENTWNRKLHSVLLSFHNNIVLFLF